jgi:ABC-type uncharacterized transport system substrate-binding protein
MSKCSIGKKSGHQIWMGSIILLVSSIVFISFSGLIGCSRKKKPQKAKDSSSNQQSQPTAAKRKPKILYINSYHEDYPWCIGLKRGIGNVLGFEIQENGTFDDSQSPIDFEMVSMDTKRNNSDEFCKDVGEKVKKLIDSWQPDVVMTAEDNAAKYVIVPYYKNTDIPFVFGGINWDASPYGFPCKNVTGMLEVALVKELIAELEKYSKGKRIGALGAPTATNRREFAYYQKVLGIKFEECIFVDNLAEFKKAYLEIQKKVDILLLLPPSFLAESKLSVYDQQDASKFILEHATIPSGGLEAWMAPYSLICLAKSPVEQGTWMAKTALEILDGKSPDQIPLTTNKEAKVYLNMPLAKKLGIVFPVELIEQAQLIEDTNR